MSIPKYLLADCQAADLCYGKCKQPVKQNQETGRWFITMSHPGFNSMANNGSGYATEKAAVNSMERYGSKK